jgi:hypothetical protein
MLQEVAGRRRFQRTEVQLGIGYQPVRKNENRHIGPYSINDSIYKEHFIVDASNRDRFLGRLNGITTVDSSRHIVYGMEGEIETRSGVSLYRSNNYYLNYDQLHYTEWDAGDGSISIVAGIGYWRNFLHRGRLFKSLLFVESFYNRELQALRFNPSLVSYLRDSRKGDPGYQYKVTSEGFCEKKSGGRVRYILSNRYFPMLPELYNKKGARRWLSGGVEQLGFSSGLSRNFKHYVQLDKTNLVVSGIEEKSWVSDQFGYDMTAYHSWRFFITAPWSKYLFVNCLSGRCTYQSVSELRDAGSNWYLLGSAEGALWLGGYARFHRIMVEVAYRPISISANGWYSSVGKDANNYFDLSYSAGEGGVWLMQIKLL